LRRRERLARHAEAAIAQLDHASIAETTSIAHAPPMHAWDSRGMPEIVLTIIVALVPIAALVLALACEAARATDAGGDAILDAADGDDARS
jgi:hypothetical protein